MRLIDSHCHLTDSQYHEDLGAVMERAAGAGVQRVVIPAVNVESGAAGVALAGRYPGVFASVGIHPNDTANFMLDDLKIIREQAALPKVVAIGEIGIDYHWQTSPKDVQRRAFEGQLALAGELQLPVIIHNREASEDVIAVLRAWVASLVGTMQERPGVLHSFSAPAEIAEQALALGFYLGFTGPLTYKNADDLRAIAARVPADRLLIETDGPYLAPQQRRGKRNEPAYVAYVAERLATLRNVSVEEIAATTTANAERLFGLDRVSGTTQD